MHAVFTLIAHYITYSPRANQPIYNNGEQHSILKLCALTGSKWPVASNYLCSLVDKVRVELTSRGGFMPAFPNATYPYISTTRINSNSTVQARRLPCLYGFPYNLIRMISHSMTLWWAERESNPLGPFKAPVLQTGVSTLARYLPILYRLLINRSKYVGGVGGIRTLAPVAQPTSLAGRPL